MIKVTSIVLAIALVASPAYAFTTTKGEGFIVGAARKWSLDHNMPSPNITCVSKSKTFVYCDVSSKKRKRIHSLSCQPKKKAPLWECYKRN